VSYLSFSQQKNTTENKDITTSLVEFYKLERENISIHLNKSIYLTNETIWFKGYVIEKKNVKLFQPTTNVYVKLFDENKNLIKSQLIYVTNGVFEGNIEIEDSLKSGDYYIHSYTNFMNNFDEDESLLQKLEIINTKDYANPISNSNYSIDYSVEGGKLLLNVKNTIVVKVTNCLGEGFKIDNITVVDSKDRVIAVFSTNTEGYGKFEIQNTKLDTYTIKTNIDNKFVEKKISNIEMEGININVNNYAIPNKTLITIYTNQNTLNKINNKAYTVLIQKNDFANSFNFNFDNKLSKDIYIDNKNLYEGVNIIRLLDEDLNSISERIIYNSSQIKNKIAIVKTESNEEYITVFGNFGSKIANFSTTILPKNSISNFNQNDIVSNLAFNNYLENPLINSSYYFTDFNRAKKYALDLFLTANKYKYSWSSILNKAPLKKFEFDIGVDLKGKINYPTTGNQKSKIRLFSPYGVDELSEINDKNEFEFKNILAIDSKNFHLSLIDNKGKILDLKAYTTIQSNKNIFLRQFEIKKHDCPEKNYETNENFNLNFPSHDNFIILKDIVVTEEAVEKLNFADRPNNNMSQAYKIDDNKASMYYDVLGFIRAHGYDVSQVGGDVTIRARTVNSFYGNLSPAVYIDDALLYDFSLLYNLNLNSIDEIYINKRGFGVGSQSVNGTIKIYTKKIFSSSILSIKTKSMSFLVKNAFSIQKPFKNPEYSDYTSNAFKTYGTINWVPNTYTDSEGNFELIFPKLNQKEVTLNIQGIDLNGELYFENIEIKIK